MSSDESDLTEFEDEEDIPLSSQKSKGKGKASQDTEGGYRIKGALRVPRVANYTTQSLHDQAMGGDIDLDPEYQRGVVWPEAKQIGLIDSLFRNFYVPPVIFVVEMRDDGSEHRTCVDGKQRLTSINRCLSARINSMYVYVANMRSLPTDTHILDISDKDPWTGEKFYFQMTSTSKGKLLPERYRKLFKNKQIVCIEYENLKPENEREIFQRVQLGMALTVAEKMQAFKSPRGSFTRSLVDNYVEDRLSLLLDLDTSRALDFKLIAGTVHALEQWHEKQDIVHNATKWIEKPDEVAESLKRDTRLVLEILIQLAEDEKLKNIIEIRDEKKVKKVSPAEFITICILIYHHMDRLTIVQLADAIRLMRKDVRGQEKDIRSNARCFKIMADFIVKLTKKKAKADPGKPVAAKAVSGMSKRKRAEISDDSESDAAEEEEVQTLTKRIRTRKVTAPKPITPLIKIPAKAARAAIISPVSSLMESTPTSSTPSAPLPRGPTTSQSTPAVSESTTTSTDPRRRASEIAPKPEPSPPFVPAGSAQSLPPPTPTGSWHPNPYPTPSGHGQTQTPSPNPNGWSATSLFHPDRLAALRAAKEQTSSGSVTPATQYWAQQQGGGNQAFPFTPPSSQPPGSQQMQPGMGGGGLGDSLMSRMGEGFGNQAYQQPQNGNGRGQDSGWAGRGGFSQSG
ncbi:hypothetical protein EUX98_g1542 [Antrodiella citrinella]|uniref:GmrSD restriction endonucleases N-terminal domain-containing protein n=1 Tax=Antrodiella citrinella TaxID=2447956 RepID=A0A4S4N4C5_9APHY|nr:hypothetical protein EUX98_g1542 [Antrodiella citrinella]